MIQAVLFDLDDTLYPEGEFYRGGFAVVAKHLEGRGIGEAAQLEALFESIHFQEGREAVFDKASLHLGYPLDWVPQLVAVFHRHKPRLSLPRESARALRRLGERLALGIVTDGHAAVQRNKIEALGVAALVDAVVVADDLGRRYWKPHPLPFLRCCRALGVCPQRAVFVGDNPERDMLGARNAGLTPIRIRRPDGYFRDAEEPSGGKAEYEIRRLPELGPLLACISTGIR